MDVRLSPEQVALRDSAAQVVDRALIMNEGVIRVEMPGSELGSREGEIERIYLGGVDEFQDDPPGRQVAPSSEEVSTNSHI